LGLFPLPAVYFVQSPFLLFVDLTLFPTLNLGFILVPISLKVAQTMNVISEGDTKRKTDNSPKWRSGSGFFRKVLMLQNLFG